MSKRKKPKKPKVRGVWLINPLTRIKESIKKYKRSREKQRLIKQGLKEAKEGKIIKVNNLKDFLKDL